MFDVAACVFLASARPNPHQEQTSTAHNFIAMFWTLLTFSGGRELLPGSWNSRKNRFSISISSISHWFPTDGSDFARASVEVKLGRK